MVAQQKLGSDGLLIHSLETLFDENGQQRQFTEQQLIQDGNLDTRSVDVISTNGAGESTSSFIDSVSGQGHQMNISQINRLVEHVRADGAQTRIGLDALDNVTSVEDARGNITRDFRDDFGQFTILVNSDTGVQIQTHDAAGNLIYRQDAQGRISTYRYDAADRLIERTDDDGMTRWQWDPQSGGLAEVFNEDSVERSATGARRMAESSALLVDEVLPHRSMRQWVLSVPHPLRYLFASQPKVMGKVLGIVYRTLATHLIHKAGYKKSDAHTGAVTLIQRFGGALNLNIHFHMIFLDGVYVDRGGKLDRFRWIKAPSMAELSQLTHTIAHRIGQYLERQGLLVRDAEQGYLALDSSDECPEDSMNQLQGHSITYRIAVGPHQGRKVFTLQTLPGTEEPFIDTADGVTGFSLHASVAVKVSEPKKLERICRYISRPAVSEKRLSLTRQGKVRYQLKRPYRDGTTHVIFEPLDRDAQSSLPSSQLWCPDPK